MSNKWKQDKQKATWGKAAMFTALFIVFYIIINFSNVGVAGLLKITDGANILDFEFGYNQEKANQMLTALGSDGRTFYLAKILPLDFIFPISYMLFFAGWIAFFLKSVPRKEAYKYLLLVPVLTMLFDWLENLGIFAMLKGYPDLPIWAVFEASITGMTKMVFIIGNFIAIGALLIICIIKKINDSWQRRNTQS